MVEKSEEKSTNYIDVKIFPYRFLKPTTAEKILNKIYETDGRMRVLIHGPSIPSKICYGPAKGIEVNHQDRTSINIQGTEVGLKLNVGEIIISVDVKKLNSFLEKLEVVLKENLPCEYMLMIGIFTKITATTSDYLKYGEGFENLLDQRLIGWLIQVLEVVKQSI